MQLFRFARLIFLNQHFRFSLFRLLIIRRSQTFSAVVIPAILQYPHHSTPAPSRRKAVFRSYKARTTQQILSTLFNTIAQLSFQLLHHLRLLSLTCRTSWFFVAAGTTSSSWSCRTPGLSSSLISLRALRVSFSSNPQTN